MPPWRPLPTVLSSITRRCPQHSTFTLLLEFVAGIQSTVRNCMEESLVQILSPKRRIDMLRDIAQARVANRPYVVTFCGVNGVGKSTNLAKIAFWLLENGHRVLIAACDTFRSGAVEQLRTHSRHLGALHPPPSEGAPSNVLLYDRGYGKDAAGVAMEAIHFGTSQTSVVLCVGELLCVC